ncbi:META domain-containing protein [Herbiconiux daphne]|uniref:META domain-containing protein n=1 Tax=Herbiconiux daphne TaxID=2970914 RepID=A0ABT2H415_9MICO|nr:META domain-containing protein [Herbiconiux daphne]MCS5734652.1 META domain-containing protein [Herbiconiux daphne]
MRVGSITRAIVLAAAAVAASVALTACASGAGSGNPGSGGSSGSGSGGLADAEPATAQTMVSAWVTGDDYEAPDVPFLAFADDGTWTGSDGCNGARGRWAVAADGSLTTSSGMQTLIACAGAALPSSLHDARVALIAGDDLVLADAEGTPIVTLVAAPEGTVPDAAAAVTGTWSAGPLAGTGAEAYLTLTDDFEVSGSDGCNSLAGTWSEGDDGTVVLSSMISTLIGCEGAEPWLTRAGSLTIEGDTATVLDASGTEIGTLTRTN